MTVEEYAIDLVVSGAEHVAEDDLNENGEVADDQHEEACDLALSMARTIRDNPAEFLTWFETRRGDGPIHLMIPNALPHGFAVYACDPDGAGTVQASMRQRTLHRDKATCPNCLAVDVEGLTQRLRALYEED